MIDRGGRQRWRGVIGLLCAMIVSLSGLSARADTGSDLELRILRVALFKNGLGYFTSSGNLPNDNTMVKLGQLPIPSHGTFWVGYPSDVRVRRIVTGMEDVADQRPAGDIAEVLRVNEGRNLTAYTNLTENSVIKGRLAQVLQPDGATASANPYVMDVRDPLLRQGSQIHRLSPLAIIQTNYGNVVLNTASILRVDFEDDRLPTLTTSVSKKPVIRIELESPAGGKEIGVTYLAQGITWAPSYLIDISDSSTAKLSAKAVVLNEAADLNDVQLELITGFPNVEFSDVSSPVAMNLGIGAFLRQLTQRGQRAPLQLDYATTQRITIPFREEEAFDVPMPEYSAMQEGTAYEDLFLYPVEHFSLGCGETACLPLFTADLSYKHIYTWTIPDMLDEYSRYRVRDKSEEPEKVWHACRLMNSTAMPLTTAPAEFVKDGQFVGQSMCNYTAPGVHATIRVNRAVNVLAAQAEYELERQRDAARFYGNSHDLVKVKGELSLVNRRGTPITVEVTKNLSGDLLSARPEARDTKTAKGLQRVNSRHVLVWEIDLAPGAEQTLSYTYEVYVRN